MDGVEYKLSYGSGATHKWDQVKSSAGTGRSYNYEEERLFRDHRSLWSGHSGASRQRHRHRATIDRYIWDDTIRLCILAVVMTPLSFLVTNFYCNLDHVDEGWSALAHSQRAGFALGQSFILTALIIAFFHLSGQLYWTVYKRSPLSWMRRGSSFHRLLHSLDRLLHRTISAECERSDNLDDDTTTPLDREDLRPVSFSYTISGSAGIFRGVINLIKEQIESMAGTKLSWWPLANPEHRLNDDYIRIYSNPQRAGYYFYDDIPRHLAELLFSDLKAFGIRKSANLFHFLRRDAVFLHGVTLFQVLDSARYTEYQRGSTSAGPEVTASQLSSGASASIDIALSPSVHQARSSSTTAIELNTIRNNRAQTSKEGNVHLNPDRTPAPIVRPQKDVLFLSVRTSFHTTNMRAIQLGKNDKFTLKNVMKQYKKICRHWYRAKHITGVKFYQFDSLRFNVMADVHVVNLHDKKERYPDKDHPEYANYMWRPKPWKQDEPYPGSEVLHWLYNLQHCGTSKRLQNRLPVRVKGQIRSGTRAWGMHLEEHYSIFAILLPSFLLIFVALATTGWFFGSWVRANPNDLQNASVPANLAISVLTLALNIPVTLLIFRWTIAEKS